MSGRGIWSALGALLLLPSCFAPAYVADPGPYDRVPDETREALAPVRTAYRAGELEAAHERLLELESSLPRCLPLLTFLQDVELALLEKGVTVDGLSAPGVAEARAGLLEVYRNRARVQPSAEAWVLAARLETDGTRALELLRRALDRDPECVWVRYGMAFWKARLRRFSEARDELKAAFKLDPGHLPSMRLQAWLLANAGETDDARRCLEKWLERTEGDPLTDPRARAEARVDLAALAVIAGDPKGGLAILATIDRAELREPGRAELVAGAAYKDSGQDDLAMEAARRARDLEPDELLSLVQQALLFGLQKNAVQERAAWTWVLAEIERRRAAAASAQGGEATLDLRDLLLQLQARARIERLDHDLARAAPSP